MQTKINKHLIICYLRNNTFHHKCLNLGHVFEILENSRWYQTQNRTFNLWRRLICSKANRTEQKQSLNYSFLGMKSQFYKWYFRSFFVTCLNVSFRLIMKKYAFSIFSAIFFTFCSTTDSLYDEQFRNALIGQDQMTIYTRMGTPTRIEHKPGGGKILVYESFSKSKGMFLTPNRSALKYNSNTNAVGEREGWTYTFGEHTAANDPQYTIYDQKVSALKIYINKNGKCTRYEQNLPQAELDIYHERFKHFNLKN